MPAKYDDVPSCTRPTPSPRSPRRPAPAELASYASAARCARAIATSVFAGPVRRRRGRQHRLYRGRLVDRDGTAARRRPRRPDARAAQLHRRGRARAALPWEPRRSCAIAETRPRNAARGRRAPGEFTKRAFLNGKLDLAQAEAVADLVRARTADGAALAAEQLCGGLSRAPRRDARAAHPRQGAPRGAASTFDEDGGRPRRAALRVRLDGRGARRRRPRSHVTRAAGCCATGCASPSPARRTPANRACSTRLLGAERAIVTDIPVRRATCSRTAPTSTGCRSSSMTPPACATPATKWNASASSAHAASAAGADVVLAVLDTARPLAAQRAVLDQGQRRSPCSTRSTCRAPGQRSEIAAVAGSTTRRCASRPPSPLGLDALRHTVTQRATHAVERSPADADQRAPARTRWCRSRRASRAASPRCATACRPI